jgi:hypothetical protein
MARFMFGLSLIAVICSSTVLHADWVFEDNFNGGISPFWQQDLGTWQVMNGQYNASSIVPQGPGNVTVSLSSLPFQVADFTVEFDINNQGDGGLWLRAQDPSNGVLLVVGGDGWGSGQRYPEAGANVYFHVFQNGGDLLAWKGGPWFAPFVVTPDDDYRIRVEAYGNDYRAYVNGTLVATLSDSTYTQGRVGLFDFYGPQTFDNFRLEVRSVPEAGTFALLGTGSLVGVGCIVFRRAGRRQTAQPTILIDSYPAD